MICTDPYMCPLMNMRIMPPTTAVAVIKGGTIYPQISGIVEFRDVRGGVEVSAEINGLPLYKPAADGKPPIGPFAFHIHNNGNCNPGNNKNPFPETGEHFNPYNQPHGNHAGDFPPLFSNKEYSRMIFFTDKFKVKDIIGKSVVIHENPDDFRTQPAGASGRKIACGVIMARNRAL